MNPEFVARCNRARRRRIMNHQRNFSKELHSGTNQLIDSQRNLVDVQVAYDNDFESHCTTANHISNYIEACHIPIEVINASEENNGRINADQARQNRFHRIHIRRDSESRRCSRVSDTGVDSSDRMKRPMAWNELVDVISSDESSSSDSDMEVVTESTDDTALDQSFRDTTPEGALTKRAEMYQEYMKQIPIPQQRGSLIPFTSWTGLGKSIKQLYGQPLHYSTNILLKQWDQLRIGSEEEYTPLDITIHPCKAEATIWLIEEVHRRTSSHYHITKLWLSDPMYHSFVDSIFPKLEKAT